MNDKRWAFEDLTIGREIELPARKVTAEEIVDFAAQFDAQPMHLDEEAGKASILGGLAASGWHTCAMFMRMMCDAFLLDSTSQGAPGLDYVRWKKPVRPGDTLSGASKVVAARVSAKRPNLGFVTVEHTIRNQKGDIVCELANTGMFLLRNPGAAA